MQFKDVVGQNPAKDGLLQMWHNDLLPHALMLAGPEGSGGLALGLALIQYIFCENKSEIDSCGACPNCRKVGKLEHADVHMSFPNIPPKPNTKGMSRLYLPEFREFIRQTPYGSTFDWLQHINAENKQGNITADECREIIDTLNLKSYEGGKKALVMWRPEYLGKEGNILLKMIEEPPKDTVMIFIAEDMDDILPTIKSRTQTVKLAPLQPRDIAEMLIMRSNVEPDKAGQIAHLAQGSYAEALRLLKEGDNDLFPSVKELFNHIFTKNGVGITKFAEEWSKAGREQQKNYLHYIIQLLEQCIRAIYTPDVQLSLPNAEADFVRKLATRVSFEMLTGVIEVLNDTIFYIERNANSKTQLHAMAIKMQCIVQGREIPV